MDSLHKIQWAMGRRQPCGWLGGALLAVLLLVTLVEGDAMGEEAKSSPETDAAEWALTCIDCPHGVSGFSHRAAALDSAGLAHIVYGGEQLYYASEQPKGGWEVEVVDESRGSGEQATLALDGADRPHIAYIGGEGSLYYAAALGDSWETEVVAEHGAQPIIALDSGGRPHISFYERAGPDLVYGVRGPGGWQLTVVDDAGDVLAQLANSLALDSQDRPHIVYRRGDRLKYAFFDGGSWLVTEPSGPGVESVGASLDVDAQNRPHISYAVSEEWGPGSLLYSYLDGGLWHTEVIADDYDGFSYTDAIGLHPSLRVGADGMPVVSFAASGLESALPGAAEVSVLLYAARSGSGWQLMRVDGGENGLNFPSSLMVDAQGRSQVAYLAADAVKRAKLTDGEWSTESVSSAGQVTNVSDMTVDARGRAHVVYYRDKGPFYYASGGETDWRREPGLPERNVRVAASATDRTCILSTDAGYHYGALLLRCRADATWTLEHVMASNLGAHVPGDFALDANGKAHVAYADPYSRVMVYERQVEGSWESYVVPVPLASNIAVAADNQGHPHLALSNGSSLVYATLTASGWMTETLDTGAVSMPTIAVDAGSHPHIAYSLDGSLCHTSRGQAGWRRETVAAAASWPSIDVDREGDVHLAYTNDAGQAIYAQRDDSGWHYSVVGETEGPAALALDPIGRPRIAFVAASASPDLMFAYVPFEPVIDVYLPLIER